MGKGGLPRVFFSERRSERSDKVGICAKHEFGGFAIFLLDRFVFEELLFPGVGVSSFHVREHECDLPVIAVVDAGVDDEVKFTVLNEL